MAAKGDAPRKALSHASEFNPFEGEHSDRHPESERMLEPSKRNPTHTPQRNELSRTGPIQGVAFMKGHDRPEAAESTGPPEPSLCRASTRTPLQAIPIDTSASVNQKHVPMVAAGMHHSENRYLSSVVGDHAHAAKSVHVPPPEWSQRPRVFFRPSEVPSPAVSTIQSNVPRECVFSPPPEPPAPVIITAPTSPSTSLEPPFTPPLTPPPTLPLEGMQSEEYQNEAESLSETSDEEDLYEMDDGGFPVLDPYYFESDDEKFFGYSRDAEEDDYLADDEDSFAQH